MRTYSIYSFVLMLAVLFQACTPENYEIGPAPSADQVSFEFTPTVDNPNIVAFKNTTANSIAFWNFGNGMTAKGNEVTASYAVKGDYEVTLTVSTKSGQAASTQTVSIAETNYAMLNRADYAMISGGAEALDGKTWVMDKMTKGHLGVGEAGLNEPNWWAADPLAKDGETIGIYDDKMTFNLNGFAFRLENNGDTYSMNLGQGALEGLGATVENQDDYDFRAIIDFNQDNWSWDIVEEGGKPFLVLGGGGFPMYFTANPTGKYEILTLTDDELYLKGIDGEGNARYFGFLREGYERPVEPEKPKEIKIEDIYDNFAGTYSDNLMFAGDASTAIQFTTGVNNFDPNGNAATNVGQYVRTDAASDAGWWQNVQTELPFVLDLRERHVFTMKVYMLPSNDHTTVSTADETPSWLGEVAMTPTITLRLENTKHGEAWRSRAEALHTFGEDEFGKWVEVTFDFSEVMVDHDLDWGYDKPAIEADIYDKIIIQIGGEGHTRPGTFYISDFKLL
ncbi:PKD domain-containing protein [Algivirga pacifica]|uniref:PKD domain-containing protein n=1 Tax=Algivirga pacifica TaxID=1162670 RepID=A0ABP9DJL6_9BACT